MRVLSLSPSPITDFVQNRRAAILGFIYAAISGACFYISYEIRFDFSVPEQFQADRWRLMPFVIGVKLVALVYTRQVGSLLTYFSVPDLMKLIWAMSGSSIVLLVPRLLEVPGLAAPRGVLLIDFMLSLGGLCLGRLLARIYRERVTGVKREAKRIQQQVQRIAIVGAGDAGASLAKEFIGAPSRGFKPVMFFDDDTEKHGKLIHGIPVVGKPEDLEKAKDIGTIAKAVIAMPSATAKRTREIVLLFTTQGIKVETLPSMEELASGRVRASRIRPVEVQDLLGREMVNLDSSGIKHAIENRCVLVTGAGGSIGSELCRQIAALNPKRLMLVEQAEGALFLIEQELNELGLGALAVPLVGDILDKERMEFIFTRYKPEVVFHAAAHKHVYLMERQPAEAIRNNVLGTRQLAQIAAAHGVEAFTFISTDKAINPTNVMGATKRLAEIQLMAIAATQRGNSDGQMVGWSDGRTAGAATGEQQGAKGEGQGAKREELSGKGEEQRSKREEQGSDHPPIRPSDHPAAAASAAARTSRNPFRAASGHPFHRASDHPAAGEFAAASLPSALAAMRTSLAHRPPTKFMAVRFGNVLGSSGSVIPIFKRQIANGGPVTVTHPDVTRYFMTIPEAVGLVLQSFVQGKGGEIFVLDMGQPVKIIDLAKQMIELSGFRVGEDIEIKYTGLKPGEKLFEELQHHTEEYAPTEHPRIMRFKSNSMFSESGVSELEMNLYQYDSNQLKAILKQLVPEYTPFLD
jgi:FlaA1/EpsC-like NDP-sugar epimerase